MAKNWSQDKRDGSILRIVRNLSGKRWLPGWDVVLAVLAGTLIFVFLGIASVGVLSSALTVVCILAAFGVGEYLLWGRVFGLGVVRNTAAGHAHARPPETGETQPPDEFSLQINDRERMELLLLLDRPGGSEDGAAIRRELRDKLRMFGA
jgi:hypothetical protein